MSARNTLRRVIIGTAIVAVGCLGIAALIGLVIGGAAPRSFGGRSFVVDERKSLPVGDAVSVTLATVSENITVTDGPGDTIEAWLHGAAGPGSPEAVPHLGAGRNGDVIDIHVERKPELGHFWNDLSLEVAIPRRYAGRLTVSSVSADIRMADHRYAGLSLTTTSGDVRLGTLGAGDFAMHTTSGELRATAITASHADLSSVSGDIEIKSLSGDTSVRTTSGEVRLAFTAVPSQLQASSTSGSVILELPSHAGFTLDARSTSGDISCAFPITVSASSGGGGHHALAGVVGTGVNVITARTVSGDIRIKS
jgi:lia operon protein LiaG